MQLEAGLACTGGYREACCTVTCPHLGRQTGTIISLLAHHNSKTFMSSEDWWLSLCLAGTIPNRMGSVLHFWPPTCSTKTLQMPEPVRNQTDNHNNQSGTGLINCSTGYKKYRSPEEKRSAKTPFHQDSWPLFAGLWLDHRLDSFLSLKISLSSQKLAKRRRTGCTGMGTL